MFTKLSISDLDIAGQPIFLRADLNVPLNENGQITDETRIVASLETIQYARKQGAKIILASHLGRPKGKKIPKMSLKPVARNLSNHLKQDVIMAPDCIGNEVQQLADNLANGQILLLENLRFHKGETDNDPVFARHLASLAKIYINDAFGTAHRAHASTVGITQYMEKSAAGFLLEREIEYLGGALTNPRRPFTALLGGAKVSTKIEVLENLIDKVDNLLIGGAMAFTFLKAMGSSVGKSIVEDDKLDVAKTIYQKAKEAKLNFMLPSDFIVAEKFEPDAPYKEVDASEIPANWVGMDIGDNTIKAFSKIIGASQTIVWNGPMGVFEMEHFSKGTRVIAQKVAHCKGTSIVGGGDSVAAVYQAGVADRISHISTGGGASLEFLAGKSLPAIEALSDK
jgi:3-phosphoglycerate kinase